ncbi:MAG: zinc ABC transporter substrate-binding protein, partial [Pseudomonadota bacterium]
QQLKNIVRVVKASNVKCIFAETQFNDKVVRKVASKSGINSYTMVNPLHHNSLEPSYEGLIKQLTNNVIGCLKQ